MFSSLNVIDEAEYTFDTTFQDHQYKVIHSPAVIFCMSCFGNWSEHKLRVRLWIYWIASVVYRCTWSYDHTSKSFYSPWQKIMRWALVYWLNLIEDYISCLFSIYPLAVSLASEFWDVFTVLQMQYFYHTFPFFYLFDLFSVLSQLFVYTCAKREYAEKILNILDPQRKVFRSVWLHFPRRNN